MKRFPVLIFLAIVLFSCSHKENHEEESGDWKELEEFHKIMAKVYHPLKEEENLEPAKKMMNQLADEAEKWSAADLPEKVNTPAMKEQLQKLKSDARALANEIDKGVSDEVIKEKLNQLHEQFHQIRKTWASSKESDDEVEDEDH
jgi:hypothetical protein